jgi:sterol desaturase/sphingolipid hydroxylase (fatty acid hydroxylase superfamily)
MRLTKYGYYSDFVVYPVLIALLVVLGLANAGYGGALAWLGLFFGCLALWTLLEYGLHRLVFHHMLVIRTMHQRHHDEEDALVGSPVWLSLLAHALLVFLPLLWIWGFTMASAAGAGLMLGYLWYVSIHHILHHWHPPHASYVYRLKRRHALHHHGNGACNFGVTTGIWDVVFRTSVPKRDAPTREMAAGQS